MDVKNLSPQESMAIITEMIETSKQRMAIRDLRVSVIWALLSMNVTAIVIFMIQFGYYTPWVNLLWFAVPILGFPLQAVLVRKTGKSKGVKTVIDRISNGIWKMLGLISLLLMISCAVLHVMGYPRAWDCMFFYVFIIVGFGVAVQGIILRECSCIFGGVSSIFVGNVLLCLTICNMPMRIDWVLPLYNICMLLMFMVPDFIISKKIKNRK